MVHAVIKKARLTKEIALFQQPSKAIITEERRPLPSVIRRIICILRCSARHFQSNLHIFINVVDYCFQQPANLPNHHLLLQGQNHDAWYFL